MKKKFIVIAATRINGYLDAQCSQSCLTKEEAHQEMGRVVNNITAELEDYNPEVVESSADEVSVFIEDEIFGDKVASAVIKIMEV